MGIYTPGMDADAQTASARGPLVKTTSSPLIISVAMIESGIGASSILTSPR